MKRFLRQNIVILFLLNSGNLFNYLFQLVVGRNMSPADFGGFNALNSTMVIFAAPLAIVPLVMARFTARFAIADMGLVRSLLSRAGLCATLLAVVAYGIGAACLPLLQSFLHIDAATPVLLMLGVMAGSFVLPVPWGMLQGLQRFTGYGVAGASNALFRLLGALLFVMALSWGINGALLSSLAGIVAAIAVNCVFLRDVFPLRGSPLPKGLLKEVGTYSVGMLVSSVIVMILGNLDLVLVRHYCDAEGAGLYATAAILGRIAFYLPSVLMSVLFTEAATAKESGRNDLSSLWMSMGLTALLGGGFALFCLVASSFVVKILFGASYTAAGPLLTVISAAMALLAVANILFVYFQARSEFGFVWFQVAGVGLFLGLVAVYHDTPMTVAWLLFSGIAVMLLGSLGWLLLRVRARNENKEVSHAG
ncbi:polysaccharide biosynthesis protein [Solidesulfovibrio sp.]|uniref:polysaccharide biosynthesis protein n=1 Tax=Solidesulfovibrio sp. TaxID=2910990 RepID=UPI002B1FF142|nr:polysaccharide biosynthesis protein [Solidesulfovibrio sp.]MEA5088913.1 oligosaccharide flippase family protein [Solidesulfovibrio sp.]